MKKILITGGSGFIGGNFVHYLLNKYEGYEVYNLDSLTYAGENNKHKTILDSERYTFIQEDITDKNAIQRIFDQYQFDYVVNFAAESHVDRSITNPEVFLKTNIIGTQILMEESLKQKVEKFVQVSTDEVYGELELNTETYFEEDTALAPNSPYSASKASADHLVMAYSHTYELPVNITRCTNNYGPYQFPEKLIPVIIQKALNDEQIPVYGDGKNVRDWLHVYDHCSAIDLVMHEGDVGEVYNIGGHNEKSNLDVVSTVLNQLDKPSELISFVEDRKGHDQRYAIDPTKINSLGWEPEYNFESGIRETIDWYLQNENWWKALTKITT